VTSHYISRMIMHAFLSEESASAHRAEFQFSTLGESPKGLSSAAVNEDCFELRVLEFPREEKPPRLTRRVITPSELALLQDVLAHVDAAAADGIGRGVLDPGAALALLTEFVRSVERIDQKAADCLVPTASMRAALTKD